MILALLAGCDTVSDAANGTGQAVQSAGDWMLGVFGGDSGSDQAKSDIPPAPADEPKLGNDTRPTPPSATERQQLADSLVADNANAQYTQAEQERMGDATRPLAPENAGSTSAAATPAAPATSASAPTPAAPVKKLSSSSDMPAPSPADTAPPPPPPPPAPSTGSSAAAAPAPAPTPSVAGSTASATTQVASAAPAPAPASAPHRLTASGGDIVADTYRERLAEFSAPPPAGPAYSASTAPAPSPAPADGTAMDSAGSAPGSSRLSEARGSGGAHPLSALDRSKAAASFQVAQIAFGEGTAALSANDDASLRAVAEVYGASKGTAKIGIIGHSNSPRLDVSATANREANRSLAAERASAVARALERLGVPASRIYAGATGEGQGDYAEVFVDY